MQCLVFQEDPYALACAYKIPERITKVGIVSGMAPLNEEAIKDNSQWWKFLFKCYRYSLFSTSITGLHYVESLYFPKVFLKWYKAKFDTDILTESVMEHIAISKKEAFRFGLQGAAYELMLYAADWGFPIEDITKETLLWYGELDAVVPVATGKYFATHIPKSKLTIYPQEAHSIFISHTEEILETVIGE